MSYTLSLCQPHPLIPPHSPSLSFPLPPHSDLSSANCSLTPPPPLSIAHSPPLLCQLLTPSSHSPPLLCQLLTPSSHSPPSPLSIAHSLLSLPPLLCQLLTHSSHSPPPPPPPTLYSANLLLLDQWPHACI